MGDLFSNPLSSCIPSNLPGLCALSVPAYGLTAILRRVTWLLQARDFSVIHVEITGTRWDMCN